MQDESNTNGDTGHDTTAGAAEEPTATGKKASPARKRPQRRRAASRPAGPPQGSADPAAGQPAESAENGAADREPPVAAASPAVDAEAPQTVTAAGAPTVPAGGLLFKPPEFVAPEQDVTEDLAEPPSDIRPEQEEDDDSDGDAPRRRRRRGGRGRRKKSEDASDEVPQSTDDTGGKAGRKSKAGAAKGGPDGGQADASDDDRKQAAEVADAGGSDATDDSDGGDGSSSAGSRRRRRRKRKGDGEAEDTRPDDPPNTVVKLREPREVEDEVTKVTGSTRLEAKKQRRREGREAGRRRAPVVSESEFLARREAVERMMAVRQNGERTQIAVLEDGVLVEHYVSRASDQPLIGNVYLGRVQNVLPAMEAAFVDIGRGRNAVLYAGEVDWAGLGHTDGQKRIEEVLKSGQSVVVQVTKEPAGHKGARLTSQISLPGRYVVFVPGGSMSGISRKLPEKERNRLKKILKEVVPDDAGVIVRTAAEGATEEELTHDVARLRTQWEEIQKKSSGSAPQLLYGEPDLAIKVVRDLFNEDFAKLVVSGDDAWETLEPYVSYVASSLRDRLEKWTADGDIFAEYRVDEQIAKALERKVWLPSGGSLVIDRTEAMTVIDVNTGKFTGSGGNLEETVTKNNLEAAEEIVRQLRLRDIGGIIVIDFIDMVLEANRDLVLRRLVECLGRDRTKHQVAEVTSLGLVQMTRKRIGTGLLEAFSEPCDHCNGRGLHIHNEPVESKKPAAGDARPGRSGRRDRRRKSEKAAGDQVADTIAAPKLEATATPGEASPADLMPVQPGTSAEPAGEPETTGGPAGQAAEAPADAPAEASADAPAEAPAGGPDDAAADTGSDASDQVHEERVAPATKPARRGRRRVARPAGSPDQDAGGGSAAADDPVVAPV